MAQVFCIKTLWSSGRMAHLPVDWSDRHCRHFLYMNKLASLKKVVHARNQEINFVVRYGKSETCHIYEFHHVS